MDLVSFIAEPTDDGIIEDLSKTIAARGKELMLALLEHAVEEKYALYFRSRISVNIYR